MVLIHFVEQACILHLQLLQELFPLILPLLLHPVLDNILLQTAETVLNTGDLLLVLFVISDYLIYNVLELVCI